MWDRNQMAARAAQELEDGTYVNLGIGIPTLVANYGGSKDITLQSENGMLGMGPFPTEDAIDADLINAGKQTITELDRTAYFDSAQLFGMIRCGKIAAAILGAMEVDEKGDLANWMIPMADAILERWFSQGFHSSRPADLAGYRNMLTRISTQGYAAVCAALCDADFTVSTAQLRVPTQCIVGANDLATPPALVKKLTGLINGANFELIDNSGHLPSIEQAAATSQAINKFHQALS